MKRRLFSFLLAFLFATTFVWAQRGGESTYAYLQLPVSPRIAALGGKVPGTAARKTYS